jgi:hypothetical protein
MTTLREAAQQALEALEERYVGALRDKAMEALRAALKQPVPEPVAWCDIEEDGTIHGLRYWSEPGRREHALYTHLPRREWRGLTEEEVINLSDLRGGCYGTTDFARAVEAALRSKNHE